MSDTPSPINVNLDLTKPATVFIEKVASAAGILYEPMRIKKKAEAQAEAEITLTKGKIRAQQIAQRAMARFEFEEARKQRNMESILKKAIPEFSEKAINNSVDDDWIVHFFERSRLTSDDDMQQIWARVLAGEANDPGSFSKRTVNLLAEIDKADAEMFTRMASFCWTLLEIEPQPLIFNIKDAVYAKHGVSFESLSHLDSIGLVRFDSLRGYSVEDSEESGAWIISYCGRHYTVDFIDGSQRKLPVGCVLLTQQGKELMRVCAPTYVESFEKYAVGKLGIQQIIVKKSGVTASGHARSS